MTRQEALMLAAEVSATTITTALSELGDYRTVDRLEWGEVERLQRVLKHIRDATTHALDAANAVLIARQAQSVSGRTAGLRAAAKKSARKASAYVGNRVTG